MEKLLTVSEVSELLSVSQSLVYKWVHYDLIPHVKIGTLVRFRESELDRWLKNKTHRGRLSYKIPLAIL